MKIGPKIKDLTPLHLKYRPKSLDQVIGQNAVVRSLKQQLAGATPHAFLLTGPSGCGKTSVARILARLTNCDDANILEVDGATHSGVENMRSVTEMARYRGIGERPNKFIIVDEAHALSRNTIQSLLLSIEEPPPHVYWALCTTESEKIPTTIKTRCATYDLKPVAWEIIADHLATIAKEEGLDIATEDLFGLVARRAEGSVRQAIQWLSMLTGIKEKAEINEILETAEGESEVIDIAKLLVAGRGITWKEMMTKVQSLERTSPESVRIVIVNYVGAALSRTTSEKEAVRLLNLLQCFASPYNASEKLAPLLLSLGQVLFKEAV